jgi:hypothetical protein
MAESKKRQVLNGIGAYFLTGVAAISLMLVLKAGIDATLLGSQIQEVAYVYLLTALHHEDDPPITIVDLAASFPKQNGVTSRKALTAMLQVIADRSPRAIGIDIDFSPQADNYSDPSEDEDFFRSCLRLNTRNTGPHVPVFLGIYRTACDPSSQWLGPNTEFQLLAANIGVNASDTREMPLWTRTELPDSKGPSLSYALANAYLAALPGGHGTEATVRNYLPEMYRQVGEAPFVRRVSAEQPNLGGSCGLDGGQDNDYTVGQFLVNYSPLEKLENPKQFVSWDQLITADGIQGGTRHITKKPLDDKFDQIFGGKIVLIGNASVVPKDVFAVPHTKIHLGLFLHACAVNTLINQPLYEPTDRGRWLLDVSISTTILLGVILTRLFYCLKTGADLNATALHRFFTGVVVLGILLQFVLINYLHFIWDDFIFVSIALMLHSLLEHRIAQVPAWSKNILVPAIKKSLRKSETEEE